MPFVDKITKGAASYDVQDARLKNLTATVNDLNKTSSTTLAGYGITDANITNGVITLGSNNITPITLTTTGTAAISTTGNAATANSVNHTLTVGTKQFNGAANVSIEAADLGLSKAMSFIGISSTPITDGGNENPTIDGTEITTKHNGDVVIYGAQEFVYASEAWHALGDTSLYQTKEEAKIQGYQVLTAISTPVWNTEYRLGTISSLSLTMPAFSETMSQEVRFVFKAGAAFTPSISLTGATLKGEIEALTSGHMYEISVAIIGNDGTNSYAGYACKDWE